jgi:hypothetical protein
VLSYDSVYQWDQLSTFQFTDWHPAVHTILMWLLTRVWDSPAIVSLFQVAIASLVIGYGLNSIYSLSRLPGYFFIPLGIAISANPIVGVMNVTLWKDVLYSLLVVLLTIIIFNLVRSDGAWIIKPVHFIILGFTLAGVWLFRFNGFPIVVAGFIALISIYKKRARQFAYSSLITIILILLVSGPLYSLFRVDRTIKQSYGIALINPVVAYVSSKANLAYLSQDEKQYLNNILPLDKSWPYSCYDASVFFYEKTNLYPAIKNPMVMGRILAKMAIRNPNILSYLMSQLIYLAAQPTS